MKIAKPKYNQSHKKRSVDASMKTNNEKWEQLVIEFPLVRYYNVESASKYLGIKISTLYKMTSEKRIAFVKLGNHNYFTKAMLDDYIARQTSEVAEVVNL